MLLFCIRIGLNCFTINMQSLKAPHSTLDIHFQLIHQLHLFFGLQYYRPNAVTNGAFLFVAYSNILNNAASTS